MRIASIPKDQLCYLNRNKLSRPRGTPSRQNEKRKKKKKSREGFYVTFKEMEDRMRRNRYEMIFEGGSLGSLFGSVAQVARSKESQREALGKHIL